MAWELSLVCNEEAGASFLWSFLALEKSIQAESFTILMEKNLYMRMFRMIPKI